MLHIQNLEVVLQQDKKQMKIIDDISICIDHDQTVGIVGESGCGKSMTGKAIMSLLPANISVTKGKIEFCGEDLLALSVAEKEARYGKDISIVFQNPMTSLNPTRKIKKQIYEVMVNHNKSLSTKQLKEKTIKLLEEVRFENPEDICEKYPYELSGGMLQRVLIAIAIANNPKLIILDEPTTALDVTIQFEIIQLLKELQKKHSMSFLFISHDLRLVQYVSDEIYVMYAGKIVEQGSMHEVFENPLHPYTKALFESLPHVKKKGKPLATIPGNVPNLDQRNEYCTFYNRCNVCAEECLLKPLQYNGTDSHKALCMKVMTDE